MDSILISKNIQIIILSSYHFWVYEGGMDLYLSSGIEYYLTLSIKNSLNELK